MRNLKKVLSLALVFVMVFALAVSASAAYTDQDKINDDYEASVNLLSAIKVINGKAGGQFDPTGSVTRAEMAKMIYVAANGADDRATLYAGLSTKFEDMAAANWAVNYVKWANFKGIVAGTSETTFRPMNNVTGVQAAKMILTMMGFNAELEGYQNDANWEFNIVDDAKTFGLLEGLDYNCLGRALTREEAAEMIVNGISKDIKVSYNDKGIGTYDTTTANTSILDTVFKMLDDTVTLKATGTYGMNGVSAQATKTGTTDKADTITVTGGTTLTTDTVLLGTADADLVGQKVKVYYKAVTGYTGADNEVYGLVPAGSVVKTELPAQNTDTYEVSRTSEDKVVVNGKASSTAIKDYAVIDGDTVKYIGTEATSGKKTTFTVENILVTRAALGTATITKGDVAIEDSTAKENGIAVDVADSTDAAFDIAKTGVSKVSGADAVANGDKVLVTSVFQSDSTYKYTVSKPETVEGYVTAKTVKGGVTSYTIGGKAYTVSNNMTGKITTDLGDEETALKNQDSKVWIYTVFGTKIIAVDEKDSSVATTNYMLVYSFKDNKKATDWVSKVDAQVMAYLADGTKGTYTISGLASGVPIENDDQVGTAVFGGDAPDGTDASKFAVVPYTKNADGTLTVGAAITETATNALSANYKNGSIMQVANANIPVASDAVFFIKSGEASDLKAYTVYNRNNAPALIGEGDGSKDSVAYYTDASGSIKWVLMNTAPAGATVTGDKALLYVVDAWSETVGAAATPTHYASVFDGSSVKTIKVAADATSAKDSWKFGTPANDVYTLAEAAADAAVSDTTKVLNASATLAKVADGFITIGEDAAAKTYAVSTSAVTKNLKDGAVADYTPAAADTGVMVIVNKAGTEIVALYKIG